MWVGGHFSGVARASISSAFAAAGALDPPGLQWNRRNEVKSPRGRKRADSAAENSGAGGAPA